MQYCVTENVQSKFKPKFLIMRVAEIKLKQELIQKSDYYKNGVLLEGSSSTLIFQL